MLKAQSLSKSFSNQAILNEINLDVQRGGSLVILGQSGTGKSVLLKILAGLIPPDRGVVECESQKLGMLFQKNALFDSFTVYENLDFPLRENTNLSREERQKKILQFLEWVELSKAANRFPDELSGGMQKRLGIARALIVEPEILFYDEPTAGLDPITSRMIADLILKLKNEFKTTLVIVTSDILRAYQLADQIAILVRTPKGAKLLHTGTPQETKESQDPLIKQFVCGLTEGPLTSSGHTSENMP